MSTTFLAKACARSGLTIVGESITRHRKHVGRITAAAVDAITVYVTMWPLPFPPRKRPRIGRPLYYRDYYGLRLSSPATAAAVPGSGPSTTSGIMVWKRRPQFFIHCKSVASWTDNQWSPHNMNRRAKYRPGRHGDYMDHYF